MKRTQIALAAVALVASSAALAEVKISGTLNAAIANNTTKDADGVKAGTNFAGAGGYVAGNNIVFSGSEELGGGLKAGFTLAAGLDLGNGSQGNGGTGTSQSKLSAENYAVTGTGLFTQQANVSLGGDVGTVKLGLQLSPFIAAIAGTGFLGDGNFWVNRILGVGGGGEINGTNGASAGPGATSGGFFVPNAVSYTSPSINGFTFSGLTTTKAGSNGSVYTNPVNTDKYMAYSLAGAIGDVNVSAAYHKRSEVYSGWNASANMPMGDFTLAANYMSVDYNAGGIAENAGIKVGSWGFGLGYKVSDSFSIAAQTASNDVTDGNQRVSGLHGKYTLSKSTFTYLSYVTATNGASSQYEGRVYASNVTGGGGGQSTENNRTISAGIVYSF